MNKTITIQLSFVIVGVFSFFRALEQLPGIFTLLLWLNKGIAQEGFFKAVFSNILAGGFYLLIGYFFIFKSGAWSEWALKKSQLKGDLERSPTAFEILFSLFVITGVYGLMNQLPYLINSLYTGFEEKIGRPGPDLFRNSHVDNSRAMIFLKILSPVLLIVYAKSLASYFSKKIKERSPVEISNSADPRPGDDLPSNS
jgi:hypothetical protein